MKTTVNILLAVALTAGAIWSCSEDKLDPNSIFVDSDISQTQLEKYIEREFTKPYNIAILYKYVDNETNMSYNLSPATYESSVRMTRLMQYLALEPYDEVTGSKAFMAKYFPKMLNYIGSPAYNNNGTMIIGTAEGGKKITMFNLNALPANATDPGYLRRMYFHTVHHEFGHILHQTKPYSPSFTEISGAGYVQDSWNVEYPANDLASALQDGFISQYASKDSNEDFVENIAFYITLSPAEWNARITAGGAQGGAILQQKIDLVKNYMDVSWGIDLDALRDNIQSRLANLSTFDQTNID